MSSLSPNKQMPTSNPVSLTLIAAATMTNGLGVAGTLAWKLKMEMNYFRQVTTSVPKQDRQRGAKNVVIMGRKTWESIPPTFRPLKDRINIVIGTSKNADELKIREDQDAWLFPSFKQAITYLQRRIQNSSPDTNHLSPVSRAFIIGGAQLYTDCLHHYTLPTKETDVEAVVDRLLITRILSPNFHNCDAFFPEFRDSNQIQHDITLRNRCINSDQDDNVSQIQPIQQTVWKKASSQELKQYLDLNDESVLDQDILSEQNVSYQFQMWEKS